MLSHAYCIRSTIHKVGGVKALQPRVNNGFFLTFTIIVCTYIHAVCVIIIFLHSMLSGNYNAMCVHVHGQYIELLEDSQPQLIGHWLSSY